MLTINPLTSVLSARVMRTPWPTPRACTLAFIAAGSGGLPAYAGRLPHSTAAINTMAVIRIQRERFIALRPPEMGRENTITTTLLDLDHLSCARERWRHRISFDLG